MHKAEPPPIRSTEAVEEQHAKEWDKWLDSLPPDKRAEVEADLEAPKRSKKYRKPRPPQEDDEHVSLGTCDDLASELPTPDVALDEKWEREHQEAQKCERRELLLLNHVLPTVADSPDPRLEASIVALALVDVAACQGITVEKLVAVHGVPAEQIQAKVRALQVKLGVCRADLKLLRYCLAPILADDRPGLEAETIAKAARIGLSRGESMEELGGKHGVCRASISFRVRAWCQRLGIELPPECKRNTQAYKFSNVTPKPAFDPDEDEQD